MIINFNKFFFTLFILLPPAIIIGPFVADLFVSLIAIFFIIISIKKKLWGYYQNYFFKIFILFYFYITINSFFSIDPILSLSGSLFYFRFIFFSLGVVYLINENKKLLKIFFISLILSILILSIDGHLQFFSGKNIFGWLAYDNRISGLFRDEYILGNFISRMMPIITALLFLNNPLSKPKRIFIFLVLIISSSTVVLSGDRIGIFNLVVSFLIILIFTKKYFTYKIMSTLILLVLAISILLMSSSVKTRIVDTTLEGIKLSQGVFLIGNYTHQSYYTKAYLMFLEKPIFGHGPKIFREICNEERFMHEGWNYCSTHPHNILMQLLAETGAIGTMPYIVILSFFLYRLLMQFRTKIGINEKNYINDYEVCLIAAIILSLLPIAPSMNVFGNMISTIFYLPAGLYLNLRLKRR